ncbi:MAG TPA: copper resistance protein B [Dyella sp.]
MSRLNLLSAALTLLAASPMSAWGQSMNMADMPGMSMSTQEHQGAAHDDPHAAHVAASQPMVQDALPPNDHVPPPPPQDTVHAMTPAEMTESMDMNPSPPLGMLLFDRLERSRSTNGDYANSWEAEAWWGNGIDRLWVKTEGERDSAGTQDGRLDVLWSHAWTSFWDWQVGVRQDFGQGPNRQWAAFGVQGLAPYWFETQATFYVGEQGRTAARFEANYDLRFTQRLILSPKLELNVYGRDDPQRGISSGLSDLEAGLRLRYEFSRKFAPYIGINWTRRFGTPAGAMGDTVLPARETTWLAGIRLWF